MTVALIVTVNVLPAVYMQVGVHPPVPVIAIAGMLTAFAPCGCEDRTNHELTPASTMSAVARATSRVKDGAGGPPRPAPSLPTSSGTGQRPVRRTGICGESGPPGPKGNILLSSLMSQSGAQASTILCRALNAKQGQSLEGNIIRG
jgi:hypothetical protein